MIPIRLARQLTVNDLGSEFHYKLIEVDEHDSHWDYDPTVLYVTVKVTTSDDGLSLVGRPVFSTVDSFTNDYVTYRVPPPTGFDGATVFSIGALAMLFGIFWWRNLAERRTKVVRFMLEQ